MIFQPFQQYFSRLFNLFNSILVIGQWEGDNKRLCAMEPSLSMKSSASNLNRNHTAKVSRPVMIIPLSTKKQTTKFLSANFQKMLSASCIKLRIKRQEGKQCRSR